MEIESVKIIGEHLGVPVYYDKNSSNPNIFYQVRGPIPEHNHQLEPVFLNRETGKTTLLNGEPYVPEKVDYEIKAYIMGTDNLEYAKVLIDKGLESKKKI